MKLRNLQTKTIESDTADGLDALFQAFVQSTTSSSGGIQNEDFISVQFERSPTTPPKYVAFIVYSS